MTNKKRALVGFGTLLLLGGFGAGILVARATPGGATRNKLSFAGNVQPVPAAGATVSFTFSNTDDTTTCTASAGSPSFDTSGNFVAEVDLSACPANFAFNGGSVTYSVAVNGTTIGTAQPVNPVPYAKYADKIAYDVNVTVTTATFGPWTTTDGTGATVTGYAAARAACQKTVGTKTAHWCSNDEVARYASKGGTAGLAVNGEMWTSSAGVSPRALTFSARRTLGCTVSGAQNGNPSSSTGLS
jgi:hypothetical protein